jgi:hypothetical protein
VSGAGTPKDRRNILPRIFRFMAAAGIGIALVYAVVNHIVMKTEEIAGLVLLVFFAAASLLAAVLTNYVLPPRLPEDDPNAAPADTAGTPVGVFPTVSLWPIVVAAACALAVLGLVFNVWLLLAGLGIGLFALAGFVRESVG